MTQNQQIPYNYIKQLALGLRKQNEKELLVALVINDLYINRDDVEHLTKEEIDKIWEHSVKTYMKDKAPMLLNEKYLRF